MKNYENFSFFDTDYTLRIMDSMATGKYQQLT